MIFTFISYVIDFLFSFFGLLRELLKKVQKGVDQVVDLFYIFSLCHTNNRMHVNIIIYCECVGSSLADN